MSNISQNFIASPLPLISFKDLNLDLVQFSKAVVVHEVLVIPSGCKVIADIPGGVLMGWV